MALLPDTAPGEKLLLRVWDTLIRDGIGALLSPWQIRREGRARAEVRAEEMARLAQAEQDIADIRAGRKRIDVKGNIVETPAEEETNYVHLDISGLLRKAHNEELLREAKRQINLSRIALATEEEAAIEQDSEVASEQPDPDWLSKWRTSAQDVSDEEMQQLWARILSGELKRPGSYSFHAVELLSRLSAADARIVSEIAPYVVDGFIPKGADKEFGFGKLLIMQELNIIQLNLAKTIEIKEEVEASLVSHDKVLIIDRASSPVKITLNVHRVTGVGVQLLSLGKFKSNTSSLERHAKVYLDKGLRVRLADITAKSGETIWFTNARELVQTQS